MTQTISSATPFDPPEEEPAKPGRPRIPPKSHGIQYNGCKNPNCVQFGMEPPEEARRAVKGPYALSGSANNKGTIVLKCNACGEMPPLKSNKGIAEEARRLGAYLEGPKHFCPDEGCPNHYVPVGTPGAYMSYGTNAHGSKRAKCKNPECGKVFVIESKPTARQRDTHRNREIFAMLVNKVPLSRIVKMTGISWETLYHRIGFIHSQCMKFAAHRERKLKDLPLEKLYLSIDGQDYIVNWTERHDKRNVVLKALTVADNRTGYVFANALNFDPDADRDAIEADAKACGDPDLPGPHRRHARYWLEEDYKESVVMTLKKQRKPSDDMAAEIARSSALAMARADVEAFDEKTNEEALPMRGMQIHSEYTMIAVFHHLKAMLGSVGKWRFFMDQESGIRSACLSVFKDEIMNRTAEAFYVRIEKGFIQEKKRQRFNEAKARVEEAMEAHGVDEEEAKLILLKQEIAAQKEIGKFGDRWVSMPLPTMAEPGKAVCWLTEHKEFLLPDGEPDEDHVAWLYNKASMHAVDNFFMKVRRGIAMCERSIHSSSTAGRTYDLYQPYNPALLKKVLEIFRVHHNYTDQPSYEKGVKKADRKTPAMRLGLAQAPLDLKDILYFNG